MAFTATIQSVTPQSDPTSNGLLYQVTVNFADSENDFTQSKQYSFPLDTSQTAAMAQITADCNTLKATLATAGTLQSKVGTVIVI